MKIKQLRQIIQEEIIRIFEEEGWSDKTKPVLEEKKNQQVKKKILDFIKSKKI